MVCRLNNEKVYKVWCPACGISETMIFRRSAFGSAYLPTDSYDGDGNKLESVFKPVKTFIYGELPPKECPKCGGRLRVKEHPVCH